MQYSSIKYSVLILSALATAVSQAAVLTPPAVNFTFGTNYGAVTANKIVFDNTFLTASVPAFNATLGTLQSFSVTWTLSGNYNGTLSTGGGVSSAYNGPFRIASIASSGVANATGGGGNGSGGGPGTALNLPLTSALNPLSFTQTFAVSDVGAAYDPAVLTAVTGAGPVTLQWDTPLTITGGPPNSAEWTNLTVSGTASAQISYTYNAIPEPSAAALGFAAMGAAFRRRRRM